MIIEITRRKVIKALESEPAKTLRPGQWSNAHYAPMATKVSDPNCCVCAVGAVMRRALDPTSGAEAIDDAACSAVDVSGHDCVPDFPSSRSGLLSDAASFALENPMAALSYVFEGLSELRRAHVGRGLTNRDIAGIRRSVIAFAKKHLPAKMRIEIDDSKPAKDVKVVG